MASGLAAKGSRVGQRGPRGLLIAVASALLALLLPHADTDATRSLLIQLTWSAQVRSFESTGGAAGNERTFKARTQVTFGLCISENASGSMVGGRYGAHACRKTFGSRFGRSDSAPRPGHAPAPMASGLAAKGSRVGQRGPRGLIIAVASALLALLLTSRFRSW